MPTETKPTTGQLLRAARQAAGLTMMAAAVKMDSHISLIGLHERGRHLPTARVLARYAAAYGVKAKSLIGSEND